MPSAIDSGNSLPRAAFAVAFCVALASPAQAQTSPAQIYRCVGPDGVVEYSNSPAASQAGRTCKAIEIAPITTIPAPKLPERAPAPQAKPGAAPAKPAGADDFPRVSSSAQKARDSDRKRILQDELGKEQDKLAALRKEYNNGEPERLGSERNYQKYLDRVERLKLDIARSEANVASIERELASIRD